MEEKIEKKGHKLQLNDRKQGIISGVKDVISFDPEVVLLDTYLGLLTIKGKDLHVKRLTLERGEVDIEGEIDSFLYTESKSAKRAAFASRLFK
ncbi:MAG: sporulation protein YabP [Lachnospiraceae bacterium]|nr:sporulation protein YabP [Lachnospiraceae bacterium]